jgi:hypothetical protein
MESSDEDRKVQVIAVSTSLPSIENHLEVARRTFSLSLRRNILPSSEMCPHFLHVKADQGRVHILLRKTHITLPEITFFARVLSLACPFYISHFHYFPKSKQLT